MIVWVYSGLTSRCITLIHAYYLLKKIKREKKKLIVIWSMEDACRISFYDVFSRDMFDDIEIKVIELDEYYHKYGDGIKKDIKRKKYGTVIKATILRLKLKIKKIPIVFLKFYFKHKKRYFEYHPPKEIGWSGNPCLEYLKNVWIRLNRELEITDNIFIHAYCGIIRDDGAEKVDFDVIQFKKEYWVEVEKIMCTGNRWVGVHIRRTDHDTAIKGSKTEDFIRNMKTISQQRKDVLFFLATDDIREETYLKKIFGKRIVTQENKVWGRTTKEGMQAGIIDCLCLSRCEYILGSYTSVFSLFASKYGKKKLIIEKRN